MTMFRISLALVDQQFHRNSSGDSTPVLTLHRCLEALGLNSAGLRFQLGPDSWSQWPNPFRERVFGHNDQHAHERRESCPTK